MIAPPSLRFACRAFRPGLVLLFLLLAAACSGTGGTAPEPPRPPEAHAAAPQPPPERPRHANPLPLDAYQSAMIPRWFLPSPVPERPAFTPHWYTPRVDPLFRRPATPGPGPAHPPVDDGATAQGPAHPPDAAPSQSRPQAGGEPKDFALLAPLLQGVASWYGPGFHGKLTASGETYDQHRMTAAHPTLPMGTIVRVENEANGRVVWVRVNDRGPYAKGRILDLSRAAAERLGMVQRGTAPVRIDVLRWPSTTDYALGLRAYSQYVVQVAAYPEPDKAEALRDEMQARFGWADFMLDPRPGGALSIVTGPYDDQDAALRVQRRLRHAGVTSLVRRYRK